jgi:hypothetical protein
MPVNGKNKGNTFERKISNTFSSRFEKHTGIEKSFRRNADSGSFFGGSNARRTQTHDLDKATFGDIICPDGFKFSIECKHYKTPPTFVSMVNQKCTFIDEWIKQCEHDAKQANKKVLVIMKFNNVPEMVVVDKGSVPLEPIIVYKDYWLLPLDKFLELADHFFFES